MFLQESVLDEGTDVPPSMPSINEMLDELNLEDIEMKDQSIED